VGAYSATTSYVSSHPQAVKDFYDAEVASLAYLRSHPSQTEAAIEKYNPQTTAANAAIAYKFFLNVWKPTPVVTESLIQAAFQRAATKAKASVPSNVAQYIYTAP
jgi:ABC-type nitrate/sulfonate/bicarbonate transport system substrate-binding protein